MSDKNERLVMPDHEVIYLIPGDFDGQYSAIWCDDPAPSNEHDESEAIKYIREDAAKKAWDHQQAIIDRLMLEFCPDEMTDEQIDNWKKHQKAISSTG